MSIFRNRRSDAATLPLPTPAQTVHNHPVGHGWEIVAGSVCGAILLVIFVNWLESKIGGDYTVLLLVGSPALWFASWILGNCYDKFCSNRRKMKQLVLQYELDINQARLLAAQTNPTRELPDTANDANYIKMRLALAVLEIAYRECRNGERPYTGNEARPWVRDRAYALGVPGVTVTMAAGLRSWLEGNGLLSGNQINFAKYPTWEDARRLLARRYSPAILVNAYTPAAGETTSIIDNVK